MILAGLAIAGATGTYCYSQSNQEIAVTTPAPAEAVVATEAAAAPVTPSSISDEDAKKAFSYFIGYRFGQEVSAGATTLTADDFDKDTFFQALQDSLTGQKPSMDQATIEAGMNAFVSTMQKREAVKAEANLAAGKAYQEEYANDDAVTKTDPIVLFLKQWVDQQYDEGRVTAITDGELEEQMKIFMAMQGDEEHLH